MKKFILNESTFEDVLAAEAEIFATLGTEAPEKVIVFSNLIESMKNEFSKVDPYEAYKAGKTSKKKGLSYDEGLSKFIIELVQRPEIEKQYDDRQRLFSELVQVTGLKTKLPWFVNQLRKYYRDTELERSFAQGFGEKYSSRCLDQDIVDCIVETCYGEIETDAIGYLGEEAYERFRRKHNDLLEDITSNLSEMDLENFLQYNEAMEERLNLTERYFFFRGIEIAVSQLHGIVPEWLESDTVDFEKVFNDISLRRLLSIQEDTVLDISVLKLSEKIGEKTWADFMENRHEVSYNLQCALLLYGYSSSIHLFRKVRPEFRENVHFTNKLVEALAEYIQEYTDE